MLLVQLIESTIYTIGDVVLGVRRATSNDKSAIDMDLSKEEFSRLTNSSVTGDDGSEYNTTSDWLTDMLKNSDVMWMDKFRLKRKLSQIEKMRSNMSDRGYDQQAYDAALQHQQWKSKSKNY